jgi:AraC-like DNA-binding protein
VRKGTSTPKGAAGRESQRGALSGRRSSAPVAGGSVAALARSEEVPTVAIEAYESWSGLRVAVHDRMGWGTLGAFLRPERHTHENPFCNSVKTSGHAPICTYTDWDRLHARLDEQPVGCIKVCPAGLVECVVPVFLEGRLACVLFAGVRTLGEGLAVDAPHYSIPRKAIRWPRGRSLPPPMGEAEARVKLEGLRQLGARLRLWWEEEGSALRASAGEGIGPIAAPRTRRVLIRGFIHDHYAQPTRLRHLAIALELSESRAAHLVRELFGQTFHKMLTEARLGAASALLHLTDATVANVAERSGFGDVSHFSRRFRKWSGLAPGRFRARRRHAGRGGSEARRQPPP